MAKLGGKVKINKLLSIHGHRTEKIHSSSIFSAQSEESSDDFTTSNSLTEDDFTSPNTVKTAESGGLNELDESITNIDSSISLGLLQDNKTKFIPMTDISDVSGISTSDIPMFQKLQRSSYENNIAISGSSLDEKDFKEDSRENFRENFREHFGSTSDTLTVPESVPDVDTLTVPESGPDILIISESVPDVDTLIISESPLNTGLSTILLEESELPIYQRDTLDSRGSQTILISSDSGKSVDFNDPSLTIDLSANLSLESREPLKLSELSEFSKTLKSSSDSRIKSHVRSSPYQIIVQEQYINMFRKGLPHSEEGFVSVIEMKKLLTALRSRDLVKLSKINLGGALKLANPSAAWTKKKYPFSAIPSLCSDEIASEMCELYCMSLARDIPFHEYNTSSIIENCCGYLNDLQVYPYRVTPYNIFRGPMRSYGPYISQFLYNQKYITNVEGNDYMKTWDTAVSVQGGNVLETSVPPRGTPRYLITGRDLATFTSEPYQIFHDTYNALMDLGVPMNIPNDPIQDHLINFGYLDFQGILGKIGKEVLSAAWYIKWNTMFLRPEALGIEVERVYQNDENQYKISHELLNNRVIEELRTLNGNALLSQVYPEGSPLSPSTPSGAAAIAGACVTLLKFFFNCKHEIDVYEPDNDELTANGQKTTVGDELNKLAHNIGMGCNWAGVHYPMDTNKGLKLGQDLMINLLKDHISDYAQKVNISITKFNNEIIVVHN